MPSPEDLVAGRRLSCSSASSSTSLDDAAAAAGSPHPGKGSLPAAGGCPDERQHQHAGGAAEWWRQYFHKWKGGTDTRLAVPPPSGLAWGVLGSFLGILAISGISEGLTRSQPAGVWLCASFGASAVLAYGVPESKYSAPRCLVGGQLLSGLVGVLVRLAFQGHLTWLANGVAMSFALLAMQVTTTTHPPAGGTAVIATSLPGPLPWYGFSFLLAVCIDAAVLLAVALAVNNLSSRRLYPSYWW